MSRSPNYSQNLTNFSQISILRSPRKISGHCRKWRAERRSRSHLETGKALCSQFKFKNLKTFSLQEAEFFLGDVALTYERLNFVEFSFITLADSGAFVTHAPSKLNEAVALLRPFHWQVTF